MGFRCETSIVCDNCGEAITFNIFVSRHDLMNIARSEGWSVGKGKQTLCLKCKRIKKCGKNK